MRSTKRWIITICTIGLLFGFATAGPAEVPAESTRDALCGNQRVGVLVDLTASQGKDLIQACEPLVLDVRTPSEYRSGHIAGAKLIPLQELEKRVAELQSHRQKPILIYCRSGNRSRLAASILKYFGFVHLHHLNRGILQWNRFGYPVHRPD